MSPSLLFFSPYISPQFLQKCSNLKLLEVLEATSLPEIIIVSFSALNLVLIVISLAAGTDTIQSLGTLNANFPSLTIHPLLLG